MNDLITTTITIETDGDDLPSDQILKAALATKIEDAIVIGYDPDGEFYVAAASGDPIKVSRMLAEAMIVALGEDVED